MISQFIHGVKSISIQREKIINDLTDKDHYHTGRNIKIMLTLVYEGFEFELDMHLFGVQNDSIKVEHNLYDMEMLP